MILFFQAIDQLLIDFKIREKVVAIVTDNAAAMKKTVELLKLRHSSCFAHCINLTVQDCLKVESFSTILSKIKAIVTFFHSSTLACDKLRIAQKTSNKPELKLIQEISTRWNSSYYMMKRIMEIRSEVAIAISQCQKAPSFLTAENFTAIQEIVRLLEPFDVATATISGESYVTSSLVIPLIRGISVKLSSLENSLTTIEGREVFHSLNNSINMRLKPFNTRTLNMISTLLDPRFKKTGFRTTQEADNASQILQREYAAIIASSAQRAEVPVPVPAPSTSSTECTSNDLLFLSNQQQYQISTPVSDSIIDLRQYFEKPLIASHQPILEYWDKSNNMLRVMANKYLCCPATSVPSERIFSKAGQIMNVKRNRLKDKHLNTLLFIHHNYNIFK
ncbi:zinc finger BED domain-containing protein 4-like [Eupeodes corollae]|uniref:zinc finger BED domain-containing protein 4-like n=1 Tax=Eupeodes corollae TaxID=290404 RepID=UPI0024913B41|nr:zinc finger BED domain-containing protein 4-like [Eupeodes corollae]